MVRAVKFFLILGLIFGLSFISGVSYATSGTWEQPEIYEGFHNAGGFHTSNVSNKTLNENQELEFKLIIIDEGLTPVLYPNLDFYTPTLPTGATFTYRSHGVDLLKSWTQYDFKWTPDYTQAGTYPISFTSHDTTGHTRTVTITITVNNVNRAPVANDASSITTNEDTAAPIALTGSDVDGDSLTYSVVTGPSHGTFDGSTYTPEANYNGSDSFTFKANDGTVDSNIATISINVISVNDAPVANNESVNVNEDTTSGIGVLDNDTDVDGDTLSITSLSTPLHGTAITDGNYITYTPNENYNGDDSVSYTISDGSETASATLSITVTPVNDAPAANDGSASTEEDTSVAIAMTGSDIDGDPLTYSIVTGPSHGTYDGSNYTPATDYNGSDSFTFKANDGTADSNIATISITVNSNSDSPILTHLGNQTVNEGEELAILLHATDGDADILSFGANPLPAGATFENNIFRWTPNFTQAGIYTITFTVSDGILSDSETLTIEVFNADNNTENLALNCTVTASSFYNDAYKPELAIDDKFGVWDSYEWASYHEMKPWIKFNWDGILQINRIVMYDRSNPIDHIKDAWLYLNKNGQTIKTIHLGEFPYGGAPKEVVFETVDIDEALIQVVDGIGLNVGLSEFKAYFDPNVVNEVEDLASECTVTASSYYNDNYTPEMAIDNKFGIWDSYEWSSDHEMTPWINFKWLNPQLVNKVVLYDRTNPIDHIKDAWLYLNKEGQTLKTIHLGIFPYGGSPKEVMFSEIEIDEAILEITDGIGLNIGLSEFKVYYDPYLLQEVDNLATGCTVTASTYYNSNYKPELTIDSRFGIWDAYEWASQGETTPWINFKWNTPQLMNKIVMYDRTNPIDHIKDAWLHFSKYGQPVKSIHLGMFPYGASPKVVVFDDIDADEVTLEITDGVGMNIGLSEFKAYYVPQN
jgi:hypothetical protein